jgi:GntR family transcriptional regulator
MAVGFFGDLFTERTGRAVTKGQRTFSARQAGPEELERLEITTPSYTSVSVPVATVVFHDEEGPLAYWEDIYAPGSKVPVT